MARAFARLATPIVSNENREVAVRLATEGARKHGGAVHVYDYAGRKVQAICTYAAASNAGL